MTFEKTMADLAKQIATKASHKDTPLQESIDAFKGLTAYYAARVKNRNKSVDDEVDDSGDFNFEAEGQNGGQHPKVPASRNS